jgi:hypothetical protein
LTLPRINHYNLVSLQTGYPLYPPSTSPAGGRFRPDSRCLQFPVHFPATQCHHMARYDSRTILLSPPHGACAPIISTSWQHRVPCIQWLQFHVHRFCSPAIRPDDIWMPPRRSVRFGLERRTASSVLAWRLNRANVFTLHVTRLPAAVLILEQHSESDFTFLNLTTVFSNVLFYHQR